MTISEVVSARTNPQDIQLRINSATPLSEALIKQVEQACDGAEDTSGESVVVLHVADGIGGSHAWPGEVGIHLVNKWERALRRLERSPSAVIATASGHCSGPALDLLLTADYRIATNDLRLSPPVTEGQLWPGMALHRLANQIGVARARRLVLFGSDVTASRAVQLGIIDEIGDTTACLSDAVAYAATLFSGVVGTELAIRRRLLLDATTTSFEDSLGTHLAACDRMLRRVRQAD